MSLGQLPAERPRVERASLRPCRSHDGSEGATQWRLSSLGAALAGRTRLTGRAPRSRRTKLGPQGRADRAEEPLGPPAGSARGAPAGRARAHRLRKAREAGSLVFGRSASVAFHPAALAKSEVASWLPAERDYAML